MISVFVSSAIDRGFELRSGQIEDYKTGIYRFSAQQNTVLRRKSKDQFTLNQDNLSVLNHMFIRGLLYQ